MAAGERVIRTPEQLGSLLRGTRRQRNLSQQELGVQASGTSQARVSQLELQPGRYTVDRLLQILAALDLNWWYDPGRPASSPPSGDGQTSAGALPGRMDER